MSKAAEPNCLFEYFFGRAPKSSHLLPFHRIALHNLAISAEEASYFRRSPSHIHGWTSSKRGPTFQPTPDQMPSEPWMKEKQGEGGRVASVEDPAPLSAIDFWGNTIWGSTSCFKPTYLGGPQPSGSLAF